MAMSRDWYGMEIEDKVNRATGRAVIAIGVNVASETKRVTHRLTGNLARSIHVAEVGYEQGDSDEAQAANTDLLFESLPTVESTRTELGSAVEVGSWLPYACVEWVGRKHPGINEGMEVVRGARADSIIKQAFLEEGLV